MNEIDIQIARQTVQNVAERDVENIYKALRSKVSALTGKQPLLKGLVDNYISSKEDSWVKSLQDLVNVSVESAFSNPEISIADATTKVNELLGLGIDSFLNKHLGFSLSSQGVDMFDVLKQITL